MSSNAQSQPATVTFLVVAVLAIWMILAAFPFLWTLWGSFKVEGDFFSKANWANTLTGKLTAVETGGIFTGDGYYGAWIQEEFWRAAWNSTIVCFFCGNNFANTGNIGRLCIGAVYLSLCLLVLTGGTDFSCHATNHASVRLPSSVLSMEPLGPYSYNGCRFSRNQSAIHPVDVTFVLQNIPAELDESAMVDGCTRFQAFRNVIIPVMWPGVITTGLFSFLLAYNDFAVTTMLLSKENQTMIPKVASFLGTTQTKGNVMFAVSSVVSVTAPLFLMVLFFQRQIVSGLTAGAVKG